MTSPFGLQVNEKGAATEEEAPGTTINEVRDALGDSCSVHFVPSCRHNDFSLSTT